MAPFSQGVSKLGIALNRMVRPYLTFFISTLYNLVLVGMLIEGELKITEYMTAVGPINAMILGFWFGEKSALRDEMLEAEPPPSREPEAETRK